MSYPDCQRPEKIGAHGLPLKGGKVKRMLDQPGRIPRFRDHGSIYYADTCEPLRKAVGADQIGLHALARENYPGDPIPQDAPAEVRTVGYWDASRKQDWGLGWHRNEGIEFTYLARGSLGFAVDETEYQLHRGHLTITRPWQSHRVGLPDIDPSRLHWLILDVGVRCPSQSWNWPSWIMLAPGDLAKLTTLLQFNEHPVWAASGTIERIFETLAESSSDPSRPGFASELRLKINELLLEVLRLLLTKGVTLDEKLVSSRRSVELFLSDLQVSVDEDWTLETMAEAAGLGRTQFSRHCQAITNMTPIEYLTHCRILTAASLLEHRSDLSVTDVAYASGFRSSQYFSSQFRRYFLKTPSAYREAFTAENRRA